MKNSRKLYVSRSIIPDIRFHGYPLSSDLYKVTRLQNDIKYYEVDEEKLLLKLEAMLALLDHHL